MQRPLRLKLHGTTKICLQAAMSDSQATTETHGSRPLELGPQALASWSQLLIAGGSCATALGQVALHSELGSLPHTAALVCLVASFVIMLFTPLVSGKVTAIAIPTKHIHRSFSFATIPLYRKTVHFHDAAWVRVRFDGYQELFVEAGTRGFETTEVLHIPFDKGAGVPIAETKACQLAAYWGVENKGYKGIA